jgi:hypothetical protein
MSLSAEALPDEFIPQHYRRSGFRLSTHPGSIDGFAVRISKNAVTVFNGLTNRGKFAQH